METQTIKLPKPITSRTLEEKYFAEKLITRFVPHSLSSVDYLNDPQTEEQLTADKYSIPCGFTYFWTRSKEGKFTESDFLEARGRHPLLLYLGTVHGRLLLGRAYENDGYECMELLPTPFADQHKRFCAASEKSGICLQRDFFIIEHFDYRAGNELDFKDRFIRDLPHKFYTHANVRLDMLAVMLSGMGDGEQAETWLRRGFIQGNNDYLYKYVTGEGVKKT